MSIPAAIRDELEQNAAWWQREYDTLNRRYFPPKPFDPSEHDGHDLINITTYTDHTPRYVCPTCQEQQ